MLKLTTFVCFMLVGMLYAAKMSCESCGQECLPSCGTRRYRACCFNYLRKKRGPETAKFLAFENQEDSPAIAVFVLKHPENWRDNLASISKLNFDEDKTENGLTSV